MNWWDDFLAAEKNPVRLMWGALPPNVRDAYGSGARALGTLAGELSPGAAFRDAGQESVNMMGAVREGNWIDAAAGPAKMATAMAGIVPIGKGAKAVSNIVQEAAAPIRAYHGSPHSFDKFDINKIGTGEGAQAYGHGLYFAGNEDVARSYKRAGPAAYSQVDDINKQMNQISREMDKISTGYRQFSDPVRGKQLADEYDALMAKRSDLGHMYEVGIHADPAKMLNWDKPLTQQSEAVKSLDDLYWQQHAQRQPDITRFLQSEEAAKAAQERGIPGIKYLDRGSRAQGAGTSNYVVFDPSIIEILRKYGLLPATVAAGVGGAAALPSNDIPPGGLF